MEVKMQKESAIGLLTVLLAASRHQREIESALEADRMRAIAKSVSDALVRMALSVGSTEKPEYEALLLQLIRDAVNTALVALPTIASLTDEIDLHKKGSKKGKEPFDLSASIAKIGSSPEMLLTMRLRAVVKLGNHLWNILKRNLIDRSSFHPSGVFAEGQVAADSSLSHPIKSLKPGEIQKAIGFYQAALSMFDKSACAQEEQCRSLAQGINMIKSIMRALCPSLDQSANYSLGQAVIEQKEVLKSSFSELQQRCLKIIELIIGLLEEILAVPESAPSS